MQKLPNPQTIQQIKHTAAKLLIALCIIGMMPLSAYAAFQPRAVLLGSSTASAVTTHRFDITAPTTGLSTIASSTSGANTTKYPVSDIANINSA